MTEDWMTGSELSELILLARTPDNKRFSPIRSDASPRFTRLRGILVGEVIDATEEELEAIDELREVAAR